MDASINPSAGGNEVQVGMRLRHARLMKGLMQSELAALVGCTESFVSKLERNKAKPSFAMLHRLAKALDLNVPLLFADELSGDEPVTIVRATERPAIHANASRKGPGITLFRLIPTASTNLLQANIHVVEPGGGTDEEIQHDGEEMGFVLEGVLELKVDGRSYLAEAGACFFFKSHLPHAYRNPGEERTLVVWVNTPPTF